jgi:hypothetical protein
MTKPKPAPEPEHVHGPDCNHDDHHHGLAPEPYRRAEPKLGRNDPCFCGSGRKYKKCHGAAGPGGATA